MLQRSSPKVHRTPIRVPAFLDGLTGLAGRECLLDEATMALRRNDGLVAVVYLDIEGLRGVNESMGLTAGDEVIASLALRLREAVRHGDTATRVGGDEFALVCSHLVDAEEALSMATRIAHEAERAHDVDGREVPLRVSLGVSVGRSPITALELLRDASAAMYSAKTRGGGLVLYSDELRRKSADRFELESALRVAIDQEAFLLHYQPLVSLANMRVVGTEALIRWHSADRGAWIPPAEFIPIAEQSGLIITIGQWVMAAATAQLEIWHGRGHRLSMSLNLSARQLAHADLPYEISQLIDKTGVDPSRVTLEVTETAVMEHLAVAVPIMCILRELGVRLSIDDFGTGQASLTQLRYIPADELKLDRSFIIDLADDRRERALVKAAIEMAHALELEVVAEGVETAAQLDILHELGCDTVQGYFLARPAPADAVVLDLGIRSA